jgi:hypothetical protein
MDLCNITPGTVISGTLRNQDLIPAFIATMHRIGQGEMAKILTPPLDVYLNDDHKWWDSEEASELLHEVMEKLSDAAAEHGYYFGSHEGDGSDYGFWEI